MELDAEEVGVGVDRTADTGRNRRNEVGEGALAKGARKPEKEGTGRNADGGDVLDNPSGDGPRGCGTNVPAVPVASFITGCGSAEGSSKGSVADSSTGNRSSGLGHAADAERSGARCGELNMSGPLPVAVSAPLQFV